MAASNEQRPPHIVILPSAGIGHLIPFCRLAVALSDNGCDVSFVSFQPTVSSAESHLVAYLFATFPRIHPLEFHLPAHVSSSFAAVDPFFVHFEAIRQSANLVVPLLGSSSPPISALIIDISLASTYLPVAVGLGLKSYIFFTSSAVMLSLCAYFPVYQDTKTTAGIGDIDIPGLQRLPKAWIIPALHNPDHLFTTQFVGSGRALLQASGILVNSFGTLEPKTFTALNGGEVLPGLPVVIPVGPLLQPLGYICQSGSLLPWLDEQPRRSVVYVCFGSRTAMSKDQIKELGYGLEASGCRFLWVVKTSVVDKEEDKGDNLDALLGDEFMERVKGRGLVVKEWVEQEQVLRHGSIGGFVSHCGWNSVTEAAFYGVPVLAWPRGGDQRVNAEVVARSGLGIWMEKWSWESEEEVVRGEEISRGIRKLMEDEELRASAGRVREEALTAVAVGGNSYEGLSLLRVHG
ncbi:UDP-glycosyltransferase CGT-like [Typha angustifolia]|uniref:UDP-glycosyltransferase CGT-like n=1 Tax=Typha angustifolia TaxID=59011 RepID=UPI003C2AE003